MSHHRSIWALKGGAREKVEELLLMEFIVAPSALSYCVNEKLDDFLEMLEEGIVLNDNDMVKRIRRVYVPYTATILSEEDSKFLVEELGGLEYRPDAWRRFREEGREYSWGYGRRLLSEFRREELPSSLARFVSFVVGSRREVDWHIKVEDLMRMSRDLEEPWKSLSSSLEESMSGFPLGVSSLYLETFLFTAMGSGALASSLRTLRSLISKLGGSALIRLGANFGTKFREYKERLGIYYIWKVIGLASLLSMISESPDIVNEVLSSLQSPFREIFLAAIALIEIYDP